MFFDRTHSTLFDKDVQFMGSPIGFVDKCKFLGFSISRDILNRDIQSSINTFNRRCNEVSLDFSILNSDIKSKLISIFCMDAVYGTLVQIILKLFILPGGKPFGLFGNYHLEHIANLLHGINNAPPIDVMLEQRCIKFIWTLLHSPNIIVKSVMRPAIRYGYSTLGEHFRYLCYKYDLSPTLWISPLCNVYKCINDYVTDFIVTPDISHFIRELCICRDS